MEPRRDRLFNTYNDRVEEKQCCCRPFCCCQSVCDKHCCACCLKDKPSPGLQGTDKALFAKLGMLTTGSLSAPQIATAVVAALLVCLVVVLLVVAPA